MPYCIAFLYPFFRDFTEEQKVEKYGDWFLKISVVNTAEACDYIILPHSINYYYTHNSKSFLSSINALSVRHGKRIICATKGDFEITPAFVNFDIYRLGGYFSKNAGNSFVYPVFIADPVQAFFKGPLTFHTVKSAKPVVGFCGQASDDIKKWIKDIGLGVSRRLLKLINKWPFDNDPLISTTIERSRLLRRLEKSHAIQTNFIKHKQYRGGAKTKEEKEESSREFFNNIKESDYILCYRGAGNFSVRLYETMACGRIPVIVRSDNNLPFEDEINWNMFPVVTEDNYENIGEIIALFHSSLTDEEFLSLQKKARWLWEEYFTYKKFMSRWINKYIT